VAAISSGDVPLNAVQVPLFLSSCDYFLVILKVDAPKPEQKVESR